MSFLKHSSRDGDVDAGFGVNITDVPLGSEDPDQLGVDKYIRSLAAFIRRAKTPLTISIQGEWGSGKTSLMNKLRGELCARDNLLSKDPEKSFFGIWLNIWKLSLLHNPDETLLMVLAEMCAKLNKILGDNYHTSVDKLGSAAKTMLRAVYGMLPAAVNATVALASHGVVSNLTESLGSIGGIGSEDKHADGDQPGIEKLQESISDVIRLCAEADRDAGREPRKFLFFIDDLDRLQPEMAVNVLELLKNAFEAEGCIFVLAIDYEVVVRGLAGKFGELSAKTERQYSSFFDKMIQLPFSMPVSSYDIGTFVRNSLHAGEARTVISPYKDSFSLCARGASWRASMRHGIKFRNLSDLLGLISRSLLSHLNPAWQRSLAGCYATGLFFKFSPDMRS